jgi:DNA-binding transcriptional ArsR family regulator
MSLCAWLMTRESAYATSSLAIGITERAVHRILSELVEEGYVLRERQGRRNRYQVKPEFPLRHPLVQEREVGDLLEVLPTFPEVATAAARALIPFALPRSDLTPQRRTRREPGEGSIFGHDPGCYGG